MPCVWSAAAEGHLPRVRLWLAHCGEPPVSFFPGPAGMSCFNSGGHPWTRRPALRLPLAAGESVFSRKKRASDVVFQSWVWAPFWQWTCQQAQRTIRGWLLPGRWGSIACAQARGGRSGEENPENVTARLHRSRGGQGAHLPVLEFRPVPDAQPPGVLACSCTDTGEDCP